MSIFSWSSFKNAEDNQYPVGIEPSIEFVFISTNITRIGAAAALIILNNEIGFSKNHIGCICSIGRSSKIGKRKDGFICEKGKCILHDQMDVPEYDEVLKFLRVRM
ncbi:protein NO VEIN-like [Typha angustifolia]|uniref:protein NO VEIN-like n=1 Tax=Typha angustifolia TaxID=59011 RepID=UPI003C2AED61